MTLEKTFEKCLPVNHHYAYHNPRTADLVEALAARLGGVRVGGETLLRVH